MALMACTCCVGPLMAVAGLLGVSAAQLVWLASVKNYLMVFSLIAVTYNLYRSYFPAKTEVCCTIESQETEGKPMAVIAFFQSRAFLWGIALLTIVILLLPYLNN